MQGGPAPGVKVSCRGRPTIFYPLRTWWIFSPSVFEVNGLCKNAIPGLITPWWAIVSSVYPDMYSTFSPSRRSTNYRINSGPLAPGITTSVRSTSIEGWRSKSCRASSALAAMSTV
jgi:hypothetical protein